MKNYGNAMINPSMEQIEEAQRVLDQEAKKEVDELIFDED